MSFSEYGVDSIRFHTGWKSLVDSAAASAPVSHVFAGRRRHENDSSAPTIHLLRDKFQQDMEWQQKPATPFLVREMMRAPVVSIASEATLGDAMAVMESQRIGHLPVRNSQNTPIGMISQNDIYRQALKGSQHLQLDLSEKIHAHMATPLLACSPEADIREIARVFLMRRIGSLVVAHDSVLLGILTRTDLLRAWMDHPSLNWRA
jgi:CBS domain-containing protein